MAKIENDLKKTNNKRKFKISTFYRSQKWQRAAKVIPKLVLQGNWLQEAQFNIGDKVEVIVSNEFLQITKVK